jgi:phosphonate transport system substrate-binding protein
VLLVHRDSGIQRLGDLKGKTLNLLQHARACLGSAWLDTLLARENLDPAADFFGKIVPVLKTGKAVLPVFFHQVDACLVTRNGYETMIELNPQTGQHLKALATSPPFVPVIFSFRADYNAPVNNQIVGELSRWHLNPAGRQILTLFQTDSLEEHPISCLDSSLELLAEYRKLSGLPPMPPVNMMSGGTVKGAK